jgi:hypothetical protein
MIASGWASVACGNCRGYGIVAHYSATDFEGERPCPDCDGTGVLWRSPRGRMARYPGGPFASGWAHRARDEAAG